MTRAAPIERRPGYPAPYQGRPPIVLLWPRGEALPARFVEAGEIEGHRLIRFVGTARSVVVKRETRIAGLKTLLIVGRSQLGKDVEITRLWLRGDTIKEIARRLGLNTWTVESRRYVLDLPARRSRAANRATADRSGGAAASPPVADRAAVPHPSGHRGTIVLARRSGAGR